MAEERIKRDWLRILSPAFIGVILSLAGVIISYIQLGSSGGWSYIGIVVLAPILGGLIVVDVIVKLIFKRKTLVIWLVEILFLLLAGLICFVF
jgi:hypothetical protein